MTRKATNTVEKRSALEDRASVASFFVLLALPLVLAIAQPDSSISANEQRGLARLPEIDLQPASLAALPAALDRYYDDHLGLRNDMIRAWAWLQIELFGVSPSPSLVVGKQGWLFLGDDSALAQYRGTARFEPADLEGWTRVLEERRSWLASRGIEYLVVLVPNKHRIYAEFMPDSLPRIRDESQLDQLVDHLGRESDVPFLDLRDVLLAEKSKHRIYHRTDTHWNDLGAYASYRAIIERAGFSIFVAYPNRPVVWAVPVVAISRH